MMMMMNIAFLQRFSSRGIGDGKACENKDASDDVSVAAAARRGADGGRVVGRCGRRRRRLHE